MMIYFLLSSLFFYFSFFLSSLCSLVISLPFFLYHCIFFVFFFFFFLHFYIYFSRRRTLFIKLQKEKDTWYFGKYFSYTTNHKFHSRPKVLKQWQTVPSRIQKIRKNRDKQKKWRTGKKYKKKICSLADNIFFYIKRRNLISTYLR